MTTLIYPTKNPLVYKVKSSNLPYTLMVRLNTPIKHMGDFLSDAQECDYIHLTPYLKGNCYSLYFNIEKYWKALKEFRVFGIFSDNNTFLVSSNGITLDKLIRLVDKAEHRKRYNEVRIRNFKITNVRSIIKPSYLSSIFENPMVKVSDELFVSAFCDIKNQVLTYQKSKMFISGTEIGTSFINSCTYCNVVCSKTHVDPYLKNMGFLL